MRGTFEFHGDMGGEEMRKLTTFGVGLLAGWRSSGLRQLPLAREIPIIL
jgi:hypothetical protein